MNWFQKGLQNCNICLVRLGIIFMETEEVVVTVTQHFEKLPHHSPKKRHKREA